MPAIQGRQSTPEASLARNEPAGQLNGQAIFLPVLPCV